MLLANHLLATLKKNGVDVFFGVQGGACARIIQEVENVGSRYIPVLNEQSAGFMAHGYFLATGKVAGIIFTTGPGFTNAISGIAACYYDGIPMVALSGQVSVALNLADKFGVKMVGFQEMPHAKIAKSISDATYVIKKKIDYEENIGKIIQEINNGVTFIEINDDVQRLEIEMVDQFAAQSESVVLIDQISRNRILTGLNTSKPIILLGAGIRGAYSNELIESINLSGLPVALSWGAQHLTYRLKNSIGIFGTHSPAIANQVMKDSTFVLAIGISLLQHQCGKIAGNFCPNANIEYVNLNKNECERALDFFGERLKYVPENFSGLVDVFKEYPRKDGNIAFRSKIKAEKVEVLLLSKIFKEFSKRGNVAFSDAGATLSWSYQGVNLEDTGVRLYTAFNLHPMGYSNCAAVGAAIGVGDKNQVLGIIGDGSLPMNCQELAHLLNKNIKLVILDNQGYGIIRQTQDDYYGAQHLGSAFKSAAPLPEFSVESILNGFKVPLVTYNHLDITDSKITNFFENQTLKALIIKIPFQDKVETVLF